MSDIATLTKQLREACQALREIADGEYEGRKLWEHEVAAATLEALDRMGADPVDPARL